MMDFSTIDLDKLRKLRKVELPHKCQLQGTSGNGCYLDAPGYPTYFTRSVYTPSGNTPTVGPTMVIRYENEDFEVENAKDGFEQRGDKLRALWKSLPYEHERVQAWVYEVYRHQASCYRDAHGVVTDVNDGGMFVFPVPHYKLRSFRDDPRFSDDWRAKERAAVEAYNADRISRATELATPENHVAHRTVTRFYPDAKPELLLIANPPKAVMGTWWETDATRPTPETCRPRTMGPHPVNHSWCQWCGWNTVGNVVDNA